MSEPNGKRRRLLIWASSGIGAASLILFLLWFFYFRFHVYTDDAYVHGNMAPLTPQVSGIVASIQAEETDFVEEGQSVVLLDTTDADIELTYAGADLAEMVREVAQLFEERDARRALVMEREAELRRREQDYENRAPLVEPGAISVEEFEHAEQALLAAQAALDEARASEAALEAIVEGTTIETHPRVVSAMQRFRSAWVSRARCEIRTPCDGFIAKRTVQVGQQVGASEPLLTIIPLNEIWVEANYKEVQLSRVRIGQPARVISDFYGDSVPYEGRVIGIGAGTGSVFSVLPPQNATGNWIKIVQRLPVRIALEPKAVKAHPLRLGLSMSVHIDTHDQSGPVLTSPQQLKPIYSTSIYSEQEEGVDMAIRSILAENIPQ